MFHIGHIFIHIYICLFWLNPHLAGYVYLSRILIGMYGVPGGYGTARDDAGNFVE